MPPRRRTTRRHANPNMNHADGPSSLSTAGRTGGRICRSRTLARFRAERIESAVRDGKRRHEETVRRHHEAARRRHEALSFLSDVADTRSRIRAALADHLSADFLRLVKGVSDILLAHEQAREERRIDVTERLSASIIRVVEDVTEHLVTCQAEQALLRRTLATNRKALFRFLMEAGLERLQQDQTRRSEWQEFDGALKRDVERILSF